MKKNVETLAKAIFFVSLFFIQSCEQKEQTPYYAGYPSDVGKIITTKCAVTGCHDQQGAGGCNGLDLSSWNTMFRGSSNGSVTVPYSPGFSTMMIFTNTYPDLGVSTPPSMPLYRTPLSHGEVASINNWIKNGAPNADGFVMWSDNAQRSKFYVCNQGCDNVTVFDEKSELIMRYTDVGANPTSIESPHDIAVSPDGLYWYIIFFNGQYLQKFSTATDQLVSQVALTGPSGSSWNTMAISQDGSKGFCVSWASTGAVDYVRLDTLPMQVVPYNGFPFVYTHGSALTNHDSILYVTCNSGNFLYKMNVSNPLSPKMMKGVSLDGNPQNTTSTTMQPHACSVSPDGQYLYVTCQASNEVTVVEIANDSIYNQISTGIYPQEIAFSNNAATPYAFVTCQDDTVSFPGKHGTVTSINYYNQTALSTIYAGWEPHGIAVDDKAGLVYVACRNLIGTGGPAPHHTTACGGADGYISFIDIGTQKLDKKNKVEVSVDPYEIAIRP